MEALKKPGRPVAHSAAGGAAAKKPAKVVKKKHVAAKHKKPTRHATEAVANRPAEKPAAGEEKTTPAATHKVVSPKSGQQVYALGKRKTAVAQVLLSSGNGTITVNQLTFENYFGTKDLQAIVMSPLRVIGADKNINVRAKVHGGGIHAQAESLRHAIARGLVSINLESRRTLKKNGFLTRDPRVKERKKPGLKRARRAPQFSKR